MNKDVAAYLEGLGFPRRTFKGWKVQIAERAGVEVAIVATKGTEIHLLPISERKAMSRRNTLEFIEPIIRKHGYATTRVPIDVTDHKLRERLGFKETWRDERFVYFALTELPFQRK